MAGETVDLKCDATGNPNITYEWFRVSSNVVSREWTVLYITSDSISVVDIYIKYSIHSSFPNYIHVYILLKNCTVATLSE